MLPKDTIRKGECKSQVSRNSNLEETIAEGSNICLEY